MTRVAVTGASGFIGRAVCAALERDGVTSLPIARDADGAFVLPSAGAAETVVHLAFPASPDARHRDPVATWHDVVARSTEVVTLARALGARHIVHASSGKVFGANATVPIRDTDATHPTTQLGRLKLAVESILRAGAATCDIAVTSLRIFNAYGPGQSGSFFFPTLLEGLARGALRLGELDHARDWVHVTDVANAVTVAVAQPPARGDWRAFNVSTGRGATVREILAIIRSLGVPVCEPMIDMTRLREREAPVEIAEPLALRALGWTSRISLDEGIADLVGRAGLRRSS